MPKVTNLFGLLLIANLLTKTGHTAANTIALPTFFNPSTDRPSLMSIDATYLLLLQQQREKEKERERAFTVEVLSNRKLDFC